MDTVIDRCQAGVQVGVHSQPSCGEQAQCQPARLRYSLGSHDCHPVSLGILLTPVIRSINPSRFMIWNGSRAALTQASSAT
jgi:hypothetical protein